MCDAVLGGCWCKDGQDDYPGCKFEGDRKLHEIQGIFETVQTEIVLLPLWAEAIHQRPPIAPRRSLSWPPKQVHGDRWLPLIVIVGASHNGLLITAAARGI
jgi:hypothetical protein